jgi:hypothetical protein
MAVPAADAAHLVVAEKVLLPAMHAPSRRAAKSNKAKAARKAKSAVTPPKKAKRAPKRRGR